MEQPFSSLGAKIVFSLDPVAKELFLTPLLETNSQFSLPLIISIQK
jgi:hypothetical protein